MAVSEMVVSAAMLVQARYCMKQYFLSIMGESSQKEPRLRHACLELASTTSFRCSQVCAASSSQRSLPASSAHGSRHLPGTLCTPDADVA